MGGSVSVCTYVSVYNVHVHACMSARVPDLLLMSM